MEMKQTLIVKSKLGKFTFVWEGEKFLDPGKITYPSNLSANDKELFFNTSRDLSVAEVPAHPESYTWLLACVTQFFAVKRVNYVWVHVPDFESRKVLADYAIT